VPAASALIAPDIDLRNRAINHLPMDVPDREELENQIAAIIILLWMDFSQTRYQSRQAAWQRFNTLFNERAKPVVSRIYGNARVDLGQSFGVNYQTPINSSASGVGTVDATAPPISLRGLGARMTELARRVFDSFWARIEPWIRGEEDKPEFKDYEADRTATDVVTRSHTEGEMDGAGDVNDQTGKQIVAVWFTEPGACPVCSPLHGTVQLWRRRFPEGPPAPHPNCRCYLEWREMSAGEIGTAG